MHRQLEPGKQTPPPRGHFCPPPLNKFSAPDPLSHRAGRSGMLSRFIFIHCIGFIHSFIPHSYIYPSVFYIQLDQLVCTRSCIHYFISLHVLAAILVSCIRSVNPLTSIRVHAIVSVMRALIHHPIHACRFLQLRCHSTRCRHCWCKRGHPAGR